MQVKVVGLWRRALPFIGALGLAFGSSSASAATTLDWEVTNISCGLSGSGITLYGDCDSLSFSFPTSRGQTSFLRATVSYHYTDDGLPLNYPARFQTDPFGGGTFATFESAALTATGSGCVRSTCDPDLGGVGFQTVIFGLNDHPDDLSGSVTFEAFFTPTSINPSGGVRRLFIDVRETEFAAAIPEPSTWALMACGLLALAVHARRRSGRPALARVMRA